MSGMTGTVPYYGGRFTPAQAYAAAHPHPVAPAPPRVPPEAPAPVPPAKRQDPVAALDHLLETGVISDAEYRQLRDRVDP